MNLYCRESKRNPNPITKLFSTILLSFTVVHTINGLASWIIVFVISLLFYLNNFRKEAIKAPIYFLIFYSLPGYEGLATLPLVLKILIGFIIAVGMFYLPFLAGKFFVKTSDVGAILSSMDKLRIPSAFSIPVAVMFRYFPSFKEERKNIKLAMKIRGITIKTPLRYLESVLVPLLILSSNIANDIAKAAETKCIENPIEKTRYKKIGLGYIDLAYGLSILILVIGGWIW